ncbi:putative Ribonuclease P protein subunit p25-like protein [Hypsibius exemplaris]|uniref:Ribonuclease P protein subunit p25-like protein n=1 Tax=Hypsibius exemplaris TaxID=2072580 RepID=A0A1W0WAH1_HYPEX|nr:putative Ribonuclease P protein subunit p25-like protein [Hypsibius exemplaris]
MENFEKGETVEVELDHFEPFAKFIVLPALPEDVLLFKVRGGSKIKDLMEAAIRGMNDNPKNHRFIIFHGTGPAINKVISCVEILKRRVKDPLQQITKLSHQEVQELWNPKLEGLNVIKVSRKIPAIHILLSKDPLNPDEPGFQK